MHGCCILAMLGCALSALATEQSPRVTDQPVWPHQEFIGDWQGRADLVAQVYAVQGGLRANLLKGFDAPNSLVAVLVGERVGEEIRFHGGDWSAKIAHGRFRVEKAGVQFELERVVRRSPTLGASPPPGSTVLFDGRDLARWARQKPTHWDQANGPAEGWRLVGGAVEVVPGSGSIITTQAFGDCTLHLEFRTLGEPVNSGVYLQCRYEVDLKDSYGQTNGAPCAAPGNFADPQIRQRLPNAAAPPFQWQTLDVVFRAPRFDPNGNKIEHARLSVTLNGVRLIEYLEATPIRGAARRLGETSTAPLMLQEHGSRIQFRNIWLVERSE